MAEELRHDEERSQVQLESEKREKARRCDPVDAALAGVNFGMTGDGGWF
jgi:hypothetical protein